MQETSSETWRAIEDWEGYYEVSSSGHVRSIDRVIEDRNGNQKRLRGKRLRPSKCGAGYLKVVLSRPGEKRNEMIHCLVARAFRGPRPPGYQACHNDGDFLNNRATNIRWDTVSENIRDQVRHGRHPRRNKTRCPQGHEMVPANLVPSVAHRKCLSCKRARSFFDGKRPRPTREELKMKADGYYSDIIGAG